MPELKELSVHALFYGLVIGFGLGFLFKWLWGSGHK